MLQTRRFRVGVKPAKLAQGIIGISLYLYPSKKSTRSILVCSLTVQKQQMVQVTNRLLDNN